MLAERFPNVPRIALTATADELTRSEIVTHLLSPALRDAPGKKWNHSAQMMSDNSQIWVPIKQTGEHQARHRGAAFIGPSECPPDFEFRTILRRIVGDMRSARRMQPDR